MIFLFLMINSFRRYPAAPKHFPRLANKTDFISSACQRPDDDVEAHLFPLALMAIDADPDEINATEPMVRRVVLSTDPQSEQPEIGERYVQPMPVDNHYELEWVEAARKWVAKFGFRWGQKK